MRLSPDLIRDAGWNRVTEVPRPAAATRLDHREQDQGLAQRLGLVSAAYHSALRNPTGPHLAFCWMRTQGGGPVQILVGGGLERLGGGGEGIRRLAYPPGSSGVGLEPEQWTAVTHCFPSWGRMRIRADPLSRLSTGEPQSGVRRPSIEECLLGAWTAPFAWLILAEPVAAATIDEVCAALDQEISNYRFSQADSRASAVMAEKLEARLTELRQSMSTGLWRTHALVGAPDDELLAQASGLLAAASDLLATSSAPE